MSFLIDTDIASAHLRGIREVTAKFLLYAGQLHISAVSVAEMKTWVYRSNTPSRFRHGLDHLLADMRIVDVNETVADKAGKVGAGLFDAGRPMATPDLLIGATALVHDLTVVTHNTSDFNIVPG